MTDQQRRFVDEYILSLNAAEAARKAGYSEKYANKQGNRLLNIEEIRDAINARLDIISNEKILEEKALLEFLSNVVRGAVLDENLITRLTGKGFSSIERHETRASVKDRLRAAELLLKVRGAFNRADDATDNTSKLFIETLEGIWQKKSPA